MGGLAWKRHAGKTLDRRRRFFQREMQDSILATLPVRIAAEKQWQAFERRWPQYPSGETRPFPSHEELFERMSIGLCERGQVDDDWLPVLYSLLDAGEGMVGGVFGGSPRFLHRPREAAYSATGVVLREYTELSQLPDPMASPWTLRLLDYQRYFAEHAGEHFAQHASLTMDALNFAAELRGATQAYLDVYEYPEEMRALLEIGLDWNIRFQEAQQSLTQTYADGSFVWLGDWVPYPRAISLSIDAYVICSAQTYLNFGFDYQARLLQHFGHGLMHFHCNRTDLAAAVAQLPGLQLLQYGGDTRDPLPEVDHLPAMRQAVGEIPIMVSCSLSYFLTHLHDQTLLPNVWYQVYGEGMTRDEANRLMEKVDAYQV